MNFLAILEANQSGMKFRKKHGMMNVTSLVERASRYVAIMRNEDHQSKPILDSLIRCLACLPAEARQLITFYRSIEFAV